LQGGTEQRRVSLALCCSSAAGFSCDNLCKAIMQPDILTSNLYNFFTASDPTKAPLWPAAPSATDPAPTKQPVRLWERHSRGVCVLLQEVPQAATPARTLAAEQPLCCPRTHPQMPNLFAQRSKHTIAVPFGLPVQPGACSHACKRQSIRTQFAKLLNQCVSTTEEQQMRCRPGLRTSNKDVAARPGKKTSQAETLT
jgi:hypothetical protein